MKDYLLQERRVAVNDQVVTSVQSSLDDFARNLRESLEKQQKTSSFRNQLFTGFIIAILSPIILGVFNLALQAADLWPTATGVTQMFPSRHSEPSAAGATPKP